MRGNLARFGLEAQSISFSADGQTLAYLKFDATSNIWSLPIPTYGETSNAANAKQVTTGAQIVESVSISPDERWLLYDSTLHGNADIFRVPIGGGGPEPLTSDPSDDFAPQLSPSGLLVAFHSFRTKTRDVFLLPIGGGPTEQVTNTLGQESFPIWSPDGGSIAFLDQTARDGAQRREYVVHRSGSGTWEKPIPTGLPEGVNSVTWLRDGRLVYVLAGSIGIASSEFDKGNVIYDPRKIGARPVLCMRMAPWDDRTLYFKTDAEGRASFWSIPVSGGQPTRLFTLDDLSRPSTFNSFAVGAGRVFFPVAEQRSLIWVRKLTDQKAR
jgi:Tol biopolymer transport system component